MKLLYILGIIFGAQVGAQGINQMLNGNTALGLIMIILSALVFIPSDNRLMVVPEEEPKK
jgi:hypothetical protein